MSSRHRDIEDRASDWILRREAGLTAAEVHAFADWQRADPRHADAVRRHERAWSLLDRPRATGRAGAMVQELSRRATRRRRRATLVATACAASLALGWTWLARPPAAAGPAPAMAASAKLVRPDRRVLPDGSVVELNPEAEIAVDFSGPLRRVALRKGEALFQVAHDKTRPFIVAVGKFEVQAVGTAFDVRVDAGSLDVMVTEGTVQVRDAGANGGRELVDARNKLTVSAAPAPTSAPLPRAVAVSPQAMAEELSWRAPRLEFAGTPLGEAVALMNREAAAQLVIDDPALAAIRVNGLFRANNTAAFVRLLEANFGVVAEPAGDTVRLRRAHP